MVRHAAAAGFTVPHAVPEIERPSEGTRARGLTPLYVKTSVLGCLRDVSAHAEVCHNTLVDFTGEEAFEAADDLASGPAASRPAGDVVDRRLVEPHADDDRAMEGDVRLSVPAPIETMPAGGAGA